MASADVDPSIFLSFSRKGRWIASSCQCVIAETLTVKCYLCPADKELTFKELQLNFRPEVFVPDYFAHQQMGP